MAFARGVGQHRPRGEALGEEEVALGDLVVDVREIDKRPDQRAQDERRDDGRDQQRRYIHDDTGDDDQRGDDQHLQVEQRARPLAQIDAVRADAAQEEAPEERGGFVFRLFAIGTLDLARLVGGQMLGELVDIHGHKTRGSLSKEHAPRRPRGGDAIRAARRGATLAQCWQAVNR